MKAALLVVKFTIVDAGLRASSPRVVWEPQESLLTDYINAATYHPCIRKESNAQLYHYRLKENVDILGNHLASPFLSIFTV